MHKVITTSRLITLKTKVKLYTAEGNILSAWKLEPGVFDCTFECVIFWKLMEYAPLDKKSYYFRLNVKNMQYFELKVIKEITHKNLLFFSL